MKIDQVAAQLYTVRSRLETPKEIAASLKRIRGIGYSSVQLSGLGPIDTTELKRMLSGEGLVCAATHEDAVQLLEEPERVVDHLQALDCRLTAYPFPRGVSFSGLEEVRGFCARLNRSGSVLREAGITLAYHNHDIEFMRVAGRPILEHIYAETDPEYLAAELDTYWVQAGGGSPVDWCRRMTGRLPMLHIKDLGINEEREAVFREIGQGNLDWPKIIAAAEEAGCRWFIVEQDAHWTDDDPFKSLEMSLSYITEHLVG